MRVLLIDVTCKVGSTGKIVYDLYTELNNQGHVAGIAYGRGPQVNEPNIFKFGLDMETAFHALMNRITGIHGSFSLISTIRLIRFIEKFNPDVIHIHELHGYFVNINMVMNFISKRNIKVIWTFHCEYMYEGKGHVYSDSEDSHWSRKGEYPKSWLLDFSKWNVKRYKKSFGKFNNFTIVSPSNWLANRIKNTYLNRFDIRVINNGINQEIFKPKDASYLIQKHCLFNKKIVLSVAPNLMGEHKGGKRVLELANMLKDTPYHFILIGVKEDEVEKHDNVLMIPRTENQSILADYYSLADIFLILSVRENFPTTCIESLSCGTPIVGFDTGGTSETAVYPYGKFFEYANLNEIKEYLLSDFVMNKETITNSIIDYSKKYSKMNMLDSYIQLYLIGD